MTPPQNEHDGIALADTRFAEKIGRAVRPLLEFAERYHALVALVVTPHKRGPLGLKFGPFIYNVKREVEISRYRDGEIISEILV
jgi:hypothetical protein